MASTLKKYSTSEKDLSALPEQVAAQESLRDASCSIASPKRLFSLVVSAPTHFTGDTTIPSLDYVCLVLVLCEFSRVSTCVFRWASGALQSVMEETAIGFASALMDGASQREERCHRAAPQLQPNGLEARAARQSFTVQVAHVCWWRSPHPSSLLPSTPRRTFYILEMKPAMKNSLNNKYVCKRRSCQFGCGVQGCTQKLLAAVSSHLFTIYLFFYLKS